MMRKFPTWDDIMQRRYKIRPDWCALCKDNEESIDHIFVLCPFTKWVWDTCCSLWGLHFNWENVSFEIFYKIWSKNKATKSFHALLLILCWCIWLAWNKEIFENSLSYPEKVATEGLEIISHYQKSKILMRGRYVFIEYQDISIPWGYFDGAS